MTIASVCAQIDKALLTFDVPQGADGLPLHIFLGPEHLATQYTPPRFVVVPGAKSDKYGASRQTWPSDDARLLPSKKTKKTFLEIYCWGEDWDAAEELNRVFICAISKVAVGGWELLGGGWIQDSKLIQEGRCYVLGLAVDLPITTGKWTATPQNPRALYEKVTGLEPVPHPIMTTPDETEESGFREEPALEEDQ